MPIAKGQEWGRPGLLPPGAPVAVSDAQAAALITVLDDGTVDTSRTIGLSAGDLARTLGIGQLYDATTPKHVVPVDAVHVTLDDGSEHLGLAHIVMGNLRRGRTVAAIMNAAFIGTRNLAPRAHPGDGKADVVELNLGLGDRLKAWKRMATGTHVPHPGIQIRRRAAGVVELDRPVRVRVDGVLVGRSALAHYRVIPSAIFVGVS